MKPNWSCPECGMFSSRRYSVQRHIKIKHGGEVTPIPFIEHLAGVRSGKYYLGSTPSYTGVNTNTLDQILKEVEQIRRRRIVDECLPPPGDQYYKNQASAIKQYISTRDKIDFLKFLRQMSQVDLFT